MYHKHGYRNPIQTEERYQHQQQLEHAMISNETRATLRLHRVDRVKGHDRSGGSASSAVVLHQEMQQ